VSAQSAPQAPAPASGEGPPAIAVKGVVKRFGGVVALNGVDLHVNDGEVLALLGDNGAGKSTLIKCISGVHQPDSGTIELHGEQVALKNPQAARRLGIETVFQDLALFDNLASAPNFYVGRELTRPRWLGPLGLLRKKAMRSETEEVIERLQVTIRDQSTLIGLMSGGQRQAVACARAFAFASKLVILDEPTAALGLRESGNVLRLVSRLAEQGIAVILISHNLEQVTQVADRAVVLRRGELVGEAVPTPANHEQLVSYIVGSMPGNS
jgi:D-xylose transport system ATP-binding protein